MLVHRVSSRALLKMDLLLLCLLLLTPFALTQPCSQREEACPSLCSCSSTGATGLSVLCSNASLAFFPVECLPLDTQRLSILSANLSQVTADHLRGVPHLWYLQLYYSELKLLPADLLKHVPRLEYLDLTGNQLVSLPPNIFHHSTLRTVLLRDNLIEELDSEWFSENNTLTWLDLSGNRLSHLPSTFLQKLRHLVSLDLDRNQLSVIPPDSLKNLPHLESLQLSGNKLRTLSASTFSNNRKLFRLLLQENQLHHLPATLLHGLHGLQMLFLNQNKLQRLDSGFFDDHNSTMFQLLLSMNDWTCDRRMEYLWRWICEHQQNVWFLNRVLCSGPAALENRKVVSLTRAEIMA